MPKTKKKALVKDAEYYEEININIIPAIHIDTEAVKGFIDHRIEIGSSLTQRAFLLNMNKAFKCEEIGLCSAGEALDIAVIREWKGVEILWVKNHLSRTTEPENSSSRPIRSQSFSEGINDRSWAGPESIN